MPALVDLVLAKPFVTAAVAAAELDVYTPVGRKRRSWTRDEKRRIVEESLKQGASIAEVARRHELNANLLFTWRRKMGVESSEQNGSMEILPVTITPESAARALLGRGRPDGDRSGGRRTDYRLVRRRDDRAFACAEGVGAAMIPIPSGVRVWIATGHTDMRRGMQGLALQVQEQLKRDPHAGDLYIRGRRRDLAKILWHDGVGLLLYAKRLDRRKFIWPSATAGAISISVDWRNPQLTWRPERAG